MDRCDSSQLELNQFTIPRDRPLTEDDLISLMTQLHDIREKWFNFGLALGLKHKDLVSIRNINQNSSAVALREMLAFWLSRATEQTYEDIIRALNNPTVDAKDLANNLSHNPEPVDHGIGGSFSSQDIHINPGYSLPISTPYVRTTSFAHGFPGGTTEHGNPIIPVRKLSLQNTSAPVHRRCKVIIVGDSYTGKTSILRRFNKPNFEMKEDSENITVTHYFEGKRRMEYNGKVVELEFWDTAGMEKNYNAMPPQLFNNTSAAIVVFDVTERLSFNHAVKDACSCDYHANVEHKSWIKKIRYQTSGEHYEYPVVVLVGNKIDKHKQRKVTTEEAERAANAHGVPYIETSCLESICIEELFAQVTRLLLESDTQLTHPIHPGMAGGSTTIRLINNYSAQGPVYVQGVQNSCPAHYHNHRNHSQPHSESQQGAPSQNRKRCCHKT